MATFQYRSFAGPALLSLPLAMVAMAGTSASSVTAADKCYEFSTRHLTPVEKFQALTSDPAVIGAATDQLKLPESERRMFPIGRVFGGDGGFNAPWHWHFDSKQWVLTEMSPEVCDARPSDMEKAQAGPGEAGTEFCPWAAYLLRECAALPIRGESESKSKSKSAVAAEPARLEFSHGVFILNGSRITPAGRLEPKGNP